MTIETTSVFDKTLDAFVDDNIRTIISYGGTSSSKSISIYQLLYLYAFKNPGKRIAIIGESIPVLKRNSIYDMKKFVIGDNWDSNDYNSTDKIYSLKNGSIIQFLSGSNPDSFRGYRSDVAYFDEINNISKDAYEQITMRCEKKVICSFNPTSEFWLVDEMGEKDTCIIQSTYRDNQFLSKRIIKEILKKGKRSKRFNDVYVEGNFGVVDGIIFEENENWNIVDELPEIYKWRIFGLDWGFTNDPTTLVEIRYYDKQLYIKQHIYKTHLLASDVYKYIVDNNLNNEIFKSDNSEPREIEYLRKKGLNIKGVKYPIMSSINRLQEIHLNITKDSIDTITEFRNYSYVKDKASSKYINKAIDLFNHSIDAIRYGVSEKLMNNGKSNFKVINF